MTTIVENASIVTQDKDDDFIESDDIGIVANRISAMGVGFAANHKAEPYCFIDSTGKFAIPGLINGYFQSADASTKGAFDGVPLQFICTHFGLYPT